MDSTTDFGSVCEGSSPSESTARELISTNKKAPGNFFSGLFPFNS